jgi:hypothetical protein
MQGTGKRCRVTEILCHAQRFFGALHGLGKLTGRGERSHQAHQRPAPQPCGVRSMGGRRQCIKRSQGIPQKRLGTARITSN